MSNDGINGGDFNLGNENREQPKLSLTIGALVDAHKDYMQNSGVIENVGMLQRRTFKEYLRDKGFDLEGISIPIPQEQKPVIMKSNPKWNGLPLLVLNESQAEALCAFFGHNTLNMFSYADFQNTSMPKSVAKFTAYSVEIDESGKLVETEVTDIVIVRHSLNTSNEAVGFTEGLNISQSAQILITGMNILVSRLEL